LEAARSVAEEGSAATGPPLVLPPTEAMRERGREVESPRCVDGEVVVGEEW
jgi:hypothetical protein